MANEEAVVDTAKAPATGEAGEGAPVEGTETAEEEKLFFGKYKSEEEAEKAYSEAQRKITEQGQKLSELEREQKHLAEQSKIAEALEKVAEVTAPKEEKQAVDVDAWAEGLAEKYGQDAGFAKDMATTMSAWLSESEKSAVKKSDFQTVLDENKALQSKIEEIEGSLVKAQPEYTNNKEMVDTFVSRGMPLKDAVQTAMEMSAKIAPEQPEREIPPSNVGNGRAIAAEGKKETYLSDEERKEWLADGMTEEDIAQAEKDFQAGTGGSNE